MNTGERLGPYEIVERIGAGGMGEVFRAHDPRTGRDVAIKVSAAQFSERFSREVHAVAALNHPNICTLYDVGPNYLVLELVEGPTLAEVIAGSGPRASGSGSPKPEVWSQKPGGPLPLDETLNIARQIADALEAAHEKGIVHRDLKPANIKITANGAVKVLDFGLAKSTVAGSNAGEHVAQGFSPANLTNSPTFGAMATGAGVILGTAAYMAPEQARGQVVDKRADIWAFGVVLYEMLSGRRLFEGDTASDTLASVLKEEPDWGRVPEVARPLLRRCLEKDPRRRLRDIGDAMPLLENTQAPGPAAATKKQGLSTMVAWGAAALFLAAASALAIVHFREKAPETQDAVRFEIPLPANTNTSFYIPFSISPDGRRLAFLTFGADGRFHFRIRALDSLETRDVPGTDVALIPVSFWSPDSRFLAFEADGKLKKVDVMGGPPQTICDLPGQVTGGSWNRDGVILFGSARGIMRVPAAGGSPTQVTVLDASRKEAAHMGPILLPDGRHFLYGRATEASGPLDIPVFVGSLEAKPEEQDSRQLLMTQSRLGGSALAFAPPVGSGSGYVLYPRGRALVAQPFDSDRLELAGDAVVLAENSDAGFAVSSNGILVVRAAGGQAYQLTWLDRQGRTLGTLGEPARYDGARISPDATRTAVMKSADTGGEDLWLIDTSRGTSARVTFSGTLLPTPPVWSPDSKRVAFGLFQDNAFHLRQKRLDGGGDEEVLLKSNGPLFPTDWSRDGRFLLYASIEAKTKQDIGVLSLDGKPTPTTLLNTEFNEFPIGFSPDGRRIIYFSYESGRSEVYVRPFATDSGSPRLDAKVLVSKGGGSGGMWRADGRELLYLGFDGALMSVAVTTSPALSLGEPLVLLKTVEGRVMDVTPDGKRLLVAKPISQSAPPPFTVLLNWQTLLKK